MRSVRKRLLTAALSLFLVVVMASSALAECPPGPHPAGTVHVDTYVVPGASGALYTVVDTNVWVIVQGVDGSDLSASWVLVNRTIDLFQAPPEAPPVPVAPPEAPPAPAPEPAPAPTPPPEPDPIPIPPLPLPPIPDPIYQIPDLPNPVPEECIQDPSNINYYCGPAALPAVFYPSPPTLIDPQNMSKSAADNLEAMGTPGGAFTYPPTGTNPTGTTFNKVLPLVTVNINSVLSLAARLKGAVLVGQPASSVGTIVYGRLANGQLVIIQGEHLFAASMKTKIPVPGRIVLFPAVYTPAVFWELAGATSSLVRQHFDWKDTTTVEPPRPFTDPSQFPRLTAPLSSDGRLAALEKVKTYLGHVTQTTISGYGQQG